MEKVTITPNGKVIRGSDNRTEEFDEQVEPKAMWDFKLKKTRIIFVISTLWVFVWYLIISADGYSSPFNNDVLDEAPFWWLISPVLIYWIVIPSYRWIMKGK
jgi:hypothetical protein